MKTLLFLLCFALSPLYSFSQTEYIEVKSSILKETRQIKLQLPRNYKSNTKEYPVIIVLDGDYLFEPFAGNVDYLSYWEIIPEAIVVGINQIGKRRDDGFYDDDSELPALKGADFFEFIGFEVLKYIDDNYRTSLFTIIAGMDYMANFSNFYLLKENPLFSGYIQLSPDLSPRMTERLKTKVEKLQSKTWYYLATSQKDVPQLKTKIEKLDAALSKSDHKKLFYDFDNFSDGDHYSFVAKAIPNSLLSIFSNYNNITDNEYKTKLLKANSPTAYLEDKYFTIEELYGLNVPIRIVDFLKTAEAIEEKEVWNDYQNLSQLAKKHSPNTVLSQYFKGRYFEKIGQPKRAINEYQAGYNLESAGYLNSELLLSKSDELKRTFGY